MIGMLLVVAMVMAMFAGCCLRHEWVEASCETPKTCASCGKTEGEALGHEIFWSTKDRKTAMEGECSTCGQTFEEELDWAKVGPCEVLGTWECVDHPEIKVTMNADGTALLEIDGETFEMTWRYDGLEESILGTMVNFAVDTPFGTEKAVLVTMMGNMFVMSIYTQPFTFSR